jgi:8-oxo-dGTP pyrophosphatase MutT (NUDIX family)
MAVPPVDDIFIENQILSTTFRHFLPPDRLGTAHGSLGSFRDAVSNSPASDVVGSSRKEYTTVVVTSQDGRRVLLGQKHRGFGTGLYNSFGGKVEPGEAIEEAARRELQEETGIGLTTSALKESHLGTLYFTFQDSTVEMVVHLFRVFIRTSAPGEEKQALLHAHPPGDNIRDCVEVMPSETGKENHALLDAPYIPSGDIRGCDEITPYWFDLVDIPLHTMFADDSVWLTRLLLKRPSFTSGKSKGLRLDGWFHFEPGGVEINTIRHYYLDIRDGL